MTQNDIFTYDNTLKSYKFGTLEKHTTHSAAQLITVINHELSSPS